MKIRMICSNCSYHELICKTNDITIGKCRYNPPAYLEGKTEGFPQVKSNLDYCGCWEYDDPAEPRWVWDTDSILKTEEGIQNDI